MDFSTLVAGPAQAGIQSPASKPGIGLTAGAGASHSAGAAGAAGESGFASLVALALDQLGGAPAAADGSAAGTTCHAPHAEDDVEIADAGASTDDDAALDAPIDAATLSVLIALATPIAAPAVTPEPGIPEPESVGPGSADLAAIDGDATTTAVAAATEAATPRAAAAASATAAPDFADALASATSTTPGAAPPAAALPAAALPAAATRTAGLPAIAGAAPAATPPAASVTSTAANATPVAPMTADAAATTAASQSSTATPPPPPTATADAAPAAAPANANATAPTSAPRPAHPLRQALAVIAATTPADAASTTGPTQPAAPGTAGPHVATAAAPAAADAAQASQSGRDARVVTAPRVDAASVTAAPAAAANAGASGEGSSDSARDAFRGATALFRGVDGRIEFPTASGGQGAALDLASAMPVPTVAGPGNPTDTRLRAIDAPAAARLEQALSSVDPDIRNVQAMVRTVRLFTAGDGTSEARLTLEPEHLGPVALTVRVEQGAVSAHFRAETPAAHRWIETHQQELRSGLREQGLEVKEVVVTTDPDGRRERRHDAQPSRPARTRRIQTDADSPRFEVLV